VLGEEDPKITQTQVAEWPVEKIEQAVGSGDYVPMAASTARELLQPKAVLLPAPVSEPSIRRAEYNATLVGGRLEQGTVLLQMNADAETGSIVLGRPNLESLTFAAGETPLQSAVTNDGQLTLLLPSTESGDLTGTWKATGHQTERVVAFDLQLPVSAVSRLSIRTAPDVTLASTNAIVRQKSADVAVEWEIYPQTTSVVSIECTMATSVTAAPAKLSTTTDCALRVSRRSVIARWTLSFPPEFNQVRLQVPLPEGCRVTSVSGDRGGPLNWRYTESDLQSLTIWNLREQDTVTIRSETQLDSIRNIDLPLLISAKLQQVDGADLPVEIRSSTVRLVIAGDLSVRQLYTSGIYQKEVSFPSSGDQVIELRQFTSAASASIQLEESRSTVGQSVLLHRSVDSPGEVTVYVELKPRSGRTYTAEWILAGPWQPTDVFDSRTGQLLHFRTRINTQTQQQMLHVDLRSPASDNQPAQLQLRFRSDRIIAEDDSSLPVLSNSRYLPDVIWVLAAEGDPMPIGSQATMITNVADALREEFPWLPAEVLTERQQLASVSSLAIVDRQQPYSKPAVIRARAEYSIRVQNDRVLENIRLFLSGGGLLPANVTLVFPDGIDVQLDDSSGGFRLTRTRRRTIHGNREWTLSVPIGQRREVELPVDLKVNRDINSIGHASVPQVPGVARMMTTARNMNADSPLAATVALIPDGDDSIQPESTLLEPGLPVSLSRSFRPMRLRITTDQSANRSLGVRGSLFCAVDPTNPDRPSVCLADLVVSRPDSIERLVVSGLPVDGTEVFVDGQSVWCPPAAGGLNILLPRDAATCRIQLLWSAESRYQGLVSRSVSIELPGFQKVLQPQLATHVQLVANDYVLGGRTNRNVFDSETAVTDVFPDITTLTAGPVREFLMRWKLREDQGSDTGLTAFEDGHCEVRFASVQRLWIGTVIMFSFALVVGSRFDPIRPGLSMLLLASGVVLAAFASIEIAWWMSGANAGLTLVVLMQIAGKPAWNMLCQWRQWVRSPRSTKRSSAAAAVLALFLTGQVPPDSQMPDVVIPAGEDASVELVYVRRQLVEEASAVESTSEVVSDVPSPVRGVVESDVRVSNLETQIRIDPAGATWIEVSATLLRPVSIGPQRFVLPAEGATLTSCSLDGRRVAPVRDAAGNPSVLISQILPDPGNANAVESPGDDAIMKDLTTSTWHKHFVAYTLRSTVDTQAPRHKLHVPLPWSAVNQLTVEIPEGSVTNVTVENAPGRAATRGPGGRFILPLLFNRGTLDLIVERNTGAELDSEPKAVAALTCLADVDMDQLRNRLVCHYELTSLSLAALPPQVLIDDVPGFRMVECRGVDGNPLTIRANKGQWQVGEGSMPLESFEVTWESRFDRVVTELQLPAAVFRPPTDCDVERLLVGMRIAEPFKLQLNPQKTAGWNVATLSPDELAASSLSSADRVFSVDVDATEQILPLVLRSPDKRVEMTQSVVVGIDQLQVQCQCDIQPDGLRMFRFSMQVPPQLVIDHVEVSSAGTNRLRSWSCDGGLLLITMREGTLTNCRLSLEGMMPVPASGVVSYVPIIIHESQVLSSDLMLSTSENTTAQLLDSDKILADDDSVSLSSDVLSKSVLEISKPVTIRARSQKSAAADVSVLLRPSASGTDFDVMMRIESGDEGWKGQLVRRDEFAFDSAEWRVNTNVSRFTKESLSTDLEHLPSGQVGILVLRNVQPLSQGKRIQLPLPTTQPNVSVRRVNVLHQDTSVTESQEQSISQVVTALTDGESLLPADIVDRGQIGRWDDATNSIQLVGLRSPEPSAANVVRQVRHGISVTELHVSGVFLAGRTDLLLDFGDALVSQVLLPEPLRVIRCQIDGKDLAWQDADHAIQISREHEIQRLTIDWLVPSRTAGYLPQQHRLLIPRLDAEAKDDYVILHPPRTESWVPNGSMLPITAAQLGSGIRTAFPQTDTDPKIGSPESINDESPGDQPVTVFVETYLAPSFGTAILFRLEAADEAGVRYRRRMFWPQWIPLLALCLLGVVTSGRQLTKRRRVTNRRARTDIAPGAAVQAGDLTADATLSDSDTQLPGDSQHSDG